MRRNYRRARTDKMRRMMRRNWKELMRDKSVNEMWSLFKKSLDDAVAQHVPMRKIRQTDDLKWLDGDMRRKIAEKRNTWRIWRRTGRATDKAVYTKSE